MEIKQHELFEFRQAGNLTMIEPRPVSGTATQGAQSPVSSSNESPPPVPSFDDIFIDWIHSPEGGQVANKFIRLALRAKKSGLKHYGAKGIAEVLRWKFSLAKMDGEKYKINNNWTSRLARFAEERCSELQGFFEMRELKT
ncbi:MAG: hypothetical protein WC477_07170 [Patescibacteria group bacterium]